MLRISMPANHEGKHQVAYSLGIRSDDTLCCVQDEKLAPGRHIHTLTGLTRDSLALNDVGSHTTQRHNSWFSRSSSGLNTPACSFPAAQVKTLCVNGGGRNTPWWRAACQSRLNPGLEAHTV